MCNFLVIKMRYGRCMSKNEMRQLQRTGELDEGSGGLVPVFDSPRHVEEQMSGMSKDGLRRQFREIGVRNPYAVAFFETDASAVGPIPQRNGLREFKLPSATPVRVYGLRKL
jgi:hypothetical protein